MKTAFCEGLQQWVLKQDKEEERISYFSYSRTVSQYWIWNFRKVSTNTSTKRVLKFVWKIYLARSKYCTLHANLFWILLFAPQCKQCRTVMYRVQCIFSKWSNVFRRKLYKFSSQDTPIQICLLLSSNSILIAARWETKRCWRLTTFQANYVWRSQSSSNHQTSLNRMGHKKMLWKQQRVVQESLNDRKQICNVTTRQVQNCSKTTLNGNKQEQ
jgi:hypothetical protein